MLWKKENNYKEERKRNGKKKWNEQQRGKYINIGYEQRKKE